VLAYVLGFGKSSFIVLDEPAVALHPNLQRELMTHLQSLSAQIVVITHSPYLFPLTEDQSKMKIVRFDRGERSATRPASVDPSIMEKIIPKLRQTGNERIAFASKVVLTEGKTDQAGLRALAEETQIDLDGRNVAIVDCASRDNIPDYARFCAALGLRYLAV
jgi:predicted ATP-dependent endonuclease of OLD family